MLLSTFERHLGEDVIFVSLTAQKAAYAPVQGAQKEPIPGALDQQNLPEPFRIQRSHVFARFGLDWKDFRKIRRGIAQIGKIWSIPSRKSSTCPQTHRKNSLCHMELASFT